MNPPICTNCNLDVTAVLESTFVSSGMDSPPTRVWFYCPNCTEILGFNIDINYTLCGWEPIQAVYTLQEEVIGYIPHTDGYDFSIIINLVSEFKHLFMFNEKINNNNDVGNYFRFNGFYKNLDMISDPEYSCSYFYFKKESHAKIFIHRVNKWLSKLKDQLKEYNG